MSKRNGSLRRAAALVSLSSLVAGCGLTASQTSHDSAPIVVGTTSAPSTLDPAASWDGSWELFRNIYQTLLAYPAGATEPQPDAAGLQDRPVVEAEQIAHRQPEDHAVGDRDALRLLACLPAAHRGSGGCESFSLMA